MFDTLMKEQVFALILGELILLLASATFKVSKKNYHMEDLSEFSKEVARIVAMVLYLVAAFLLFIFYYSTFKMNYGTWSLFKHICIGIITIIMLYPSFTKKELTIYNLFAIIAITALMLVACL